MKGFAIILLAAFGASAEPRAISDAEREAVTIVAEFLSRGPDALFEHLSPDAPLRVLPREQALAELAARTGPAAGARWTLQTVVRGRKGDVAFRVTFPSGYEDGLLFRMKGRNVQEILTLAEDPKARVPIPTLGPEPLRESYLVVAAFLALVGAFTARRSRLLAAMALIGAALAIAGAFHKLDFAKPAKALSFVELRDLVPLREALARGDEPRMPRELSAGAREVASLWILQSGAMLKTTVPAATTPLAGIIRARLALTNDQTSAAATAFTQALAIEPLRDDVLLEAATSFGVSQAALPFLSDPRFDESRDPRLHYARTMRAVADGDEKQARQHLRTAWTLEPIAREELIREPRLFPLLHDVGTMSMVSFYSSEEPLLRSPRLGKSPIALPAGARAFASGESLTIELRNGTLEVPGGAILAPPNVRVVAATYRKKEEDAAALRDAMTLLEHGGTLRRMRAAEALADHNRWKELLQLTDDITPESTLVEPGLLVLRLRALLRANRLGDAQALANGAAVKELGARTSFPATLLSIADAMASSGAWDTARTIYGSIRSDDQKAIVATRLKQVELRRALATDGVVIATPHFDVRHDQSMNPAIASRIGDLLEGELARVRQRLGLPAAEPRRVTVNVFYWQDFSGSITGVDHIVGLYDGEILFPFAVVNQFKPELVAIITHELTHAIVAEATRDNAPRWFQEGIAERMELVPRQENAFHETPPQLVLPLPLLDAVMGHVADASMAEQGYRVAQTFIRFLESRHANAIPALIAAFAAGKNTDEALAALTGKSLEALNQDFREWGFANSANFENAEPFPYRDLYSPGVDPRIKAGFKWSRRR
ncbi:MAG: basic secretory protein-like protein [Thermoanaerobaculia bacterium]